jgi:hypothetical protein
MCDFEMKIYATIRKQSKYYYSQQKFEGKKPVPFPVRLEFKEDPRWPVKGGVGGQYTLYDVELYVARDGELLVIPMHKNP